MPERVFYSTTPPYGNRIVNFRISNPAVHKETTPKPPGRSRVKRFLFSLSLGHCYVYANFRNIPEMETLDKKI